jgi:flagellar protein FlbD
MIWVTRLNGNEFVLNADLIEQIEAIPDTVVTLIDGRKYMVAESAYEVVDRVVRFRASILDAPHLSVAARDVTTREPRAKEGSVHPFERKPAESRKTVEPRTKDGQ